jgi:transcriptional regulator with XRE-family HTH domain
MGAMSSPVAASRSNRKRLAARLAALRHRKRLTQAQLAATAGISRRMVVSYEVEDVVPPTAVLPRLAQALDVTIDQLLGENGAADLGLPSPKTRKRRHRPRPQSVKDVPTGVKGLGERLARLRAARGMTQEEFGVAVGISSRMVAYYEVQGGNPPASLLPRFARVLDVAIDELLGYKAPRGTVPRDARLVRRLRRLERLSPDEQKAVLKLIDTMVQKRGSAKS